MYIIWSHVQHGKHGCASEDPVPTVEVFVIFLFGRLLRLAGRFRSDRILGIATREID